MRNNRIAILLLKWLLIVCQSQTSAQIVLQSTRFKSALPGETVTFNCSMAAGVSMSSYTMYWYRQDHYGQPIQFIIKEYDKPTQNYEAILNTKGTQFSLTVSNLTAKDSSTYYCAATGDLNPAYFGNGTKLTVLEPDVVSKDLKVKIVNETSCKEKVTLVCLAEDFYPDHVSIKWTLESREITEDVATDPYATQDDATRMFRISSRLKVPKKEFTTKSIFKCSVTFINEKEIAINGSAEITGTGGAGYEPEDYLKSSQTISLAYGVFIAKSALYGLVILVFVCRRGSSGKRIN